ncbi:hypothetical protein [Roseivivax isoporae]|uniref:Uncharacterized protein n=1 Tax=Roseivivax isoporae LMG 25204 TaxID=1449351 RepID=X7F6H2_9RHOB|nr:hypothetical protein [Roseivivax isoporae]ETX27654.1 hypothetical protein RISW2_11965 [Roseivivax isoporae LMG 25204]
MPFGVLIALVMCGIAGIAVLTHALGLSARAPFPDTAAARAAWLREYPALAPADVVMSRDGRSALIVTAGGPGVVWRFGADSTARLLTGARVRRCARGLDIRLPDFTAPRIVLDLSAEETDAWTRSLGNAA